MQYEFAISPIRLLSLSAPNPCRLPQVRLTAFQITGLQQSEQWFLWCHMVGRPKRENYIKNLIRHSCVLSLIVMFAFVQSDTAAHNLGFQIVRRLGIFLFPPGCENRSITKLPPPPY